MGKNKGAKEPIPERDNAAENYREFLRLIEYPQTPDEIENAINCLKAAADKGYIPACLELGIRLGSGVLYEDETLGITVEKPQRICEALEYFIKGAEAMNSPCIYQIAAAVRTDNPVFRSIGISMDDDIYLETLMAAAFPKNPDKGCAEALLELGLLLLNADELIWKGVNKPDKDAELAYAVFKQAALADEDSQAAALAGLLTAARLLTEPEAGEDLNENRSDAEYYLAWAMDRDDCRDLAEKTKNGDFKSVKELADEISRRKDNVSWPVRSFLKKEY